MAKQVLTAEFITINATDLSTYCAKAELQVKVEDKDDTNYGSGGWHEHLGGLKQGTLNMEFFNDFAATFLDSIMWPLLGTVVAFEVRAAQGARSTSNPAYTGNLLVEAWNPITGGVGDLATVSVAYSTTGVVTRQIV